MSGHSTESDARPVGPLIREECDRYVEGGANARCGRPKSEHRESFMDMREDVIDHDYDQPPPEPYDHERVPAMITTEWRCHACGADNDVWGTGATEGYMECGSCGAWSWLDFDPDGYAEQTSVTSPGVDQ